MDFYKHFRVLPLLGTVANGSQPCGHGIVIDENGTFNMSIGCVLSTLFRVIMDDNDTFNVSMWSRTSHILLVLGTLRLPTVHRMDGFTVAVGRHHTVRALSKFGPYFTINTVTTISYIYTSDSI
jgi:hypothetical protein